MPPGLLDLPAPLLHWADQYFTRLLPLPLSIALWAVLGAIISMELYRLISPQRRIADLKRQASAAQRELAAYDGELDEAWPLMLRMLRASLGRVAIVLPATLLSALPAIVLLVWMSNVYGYRFPQLDESVVIAIEQPLQAQWVNADATEQNHYIQAHGEDGEVSLHVPLSAPAPVIHKRRWWNLITANPAGYLPDDAPVDAIGIGLPVQEILPGGPSWLRGWEAIFLPVMFAVALACKTLRRID